VPNNVCGEVIGTSETEYAAGRFADCSAVAGNDISGIRHVDFSVRLSLRTEGRR
jgi:hypothetical protein